MRRMKQTFGKENSSFPLQLERSILLKKKKESELLSFQG